MTATLYALGMAVLLLYGGNLLWLALVMAHRDRQVQGPVPDPLERAVPDASWPHVTVQLPLYNEAYVAERVLDACAHLHYPRERLEIQVLDDSTDETTAIVAARVAYWQAQGLDVVHLQRAHREGYKAGALQHGLRHAKGTHIALFDADFVPTPDFLQVLIPCFDTPDVGMVQARWGHLNEDHGLLTRIQAFGLDTHFALEQRIRNLTGCFINFNGTAGIWRADCIDDAGGWHHDTLTEDLDLSYRAQMKGWRFRYVDDLEVPAELPVEMNALRAQQFRWTKGAAQTSRKMLATLWRSAQPWRVKVEGTFHLTAHFVFPFIVLVALVHAPLLWLKHQGMGPGDGYFAVMGLGLLGFVGFFLAQAFAQRTLYPDWTDRLWRFPLFMAGTMGMALSNTHALLEALVRKPSPFVRTPKYHVNGQEGAVRWWRLRYARAHIPLIVWLEVLMALYCLAGLGLLIGYGEWAAVPFQALFATGFGLVTAYNLKQHWQVRRAR